MASAPKRKRNRANPGKMGRPPFEPTEDDRNSVQVYRANGVAPAVIARRIGIDVVTLRKHFAVELAEGHENIIALAGGVVVRAMMAGDWRAALEWLSRWGGDGWKKSERRLIAGDPLGPPLTLNVRSMSDEDLEAEIAEIDRREKTADEAREMAKKMPRRTNGVGH
jgi:hypothetical protein